MGKEKAITKPAVAASLAVGVVAALSYSADYFCKTDRVPDKHNCAMLIENPPQQDPNVSMSPQYTSLNTINITGTAAASISPSLAPDGTN